MAGSPRNSFRPFRLSMSKEKKALDELSKMETDAIIKVCSPKKDFWKENFKKAYQIKE